MNIGLKIKELRFKKNMSANDLATQIGVTKESIYGYEKGTQKPPLEKIQRIADYFNVDIDFLIKNSDENTKNTEIYTNEEQSFLKSQIERWQNEAEHWRKIAFEKLGILEKFRVYSSFQK